jgi:hypothetical protein
VGVVGEQFDVVDRRAVLAGDALASRALSMAQV